MTHRDEDEEIIDSALDTLAWQRREIDRLKAEVEGLREALKVTHDFAVAYAVGTGTLFDEAMAEARAALGEKP